IPRSCGCCILVIGSVMEAPRMIFRICQTPGSSVGSIDRWHPHRKVYQTRKRRWHPCFTAQLLS
ncbi:hypothetical protein F442_17610, partial [Phytophthora nicotianae P10297]